MRNIMVMLCFLLSTLVVHAQTTVSGKVTEDETGESLAGVTVFEKGTSNGTFTDENGGFSITVADGATLVFRFVGMATVEQDVSGGTMNVSLKADELMLDEVVVTALGIKQEKKQLGYAVQSVGGDELTGSGEANTISALSGKVAGVQVISASGSPGGSAYIRIRGSNSLTGDNQPLIIVDGVPMNNDQNLSGNPDNGTNNLLSSVANSNRAIDINPDDIEDLTVLKGANAAALYGIAAANGAIVITTKSGKATQGKKVNVSLSTSIGVDQVNKLPKVQNQWAQGTGWYDYDAAGNPIPTWYGPEYGWPTSWGPKLDTMAWDGSDYDYDKNGRLVSRNDPTAGANATPYDNLGTFFKNGLNTNNNISFSGGNENASLRASYGNQHIQGIVPNSDWTRHSVRVSGSATMFDKITAAASANYVRSGGTRIQQGSNLSGLMLGLTRTSPSFDNTNGNSEKPWEAVDAYEFADGSQRNYRGGGGYDNPYWAVNNTPFKDEVDRISGFTSLSYSPVKWMNIFWRGGMDSYNDRRQQFFDIGSRGNPAGQIYEEQIAYRHFNSDLWLTFNYDFTDDLSASLILGNNIYDQRTQRLYTQGDGLVIKGFNHMSNASTVLTRESRGAYRKTALFFDAKLNFKDYLFLDVTGRNEWSSTLPADNRSFFYPSASLGFVFTEPAGLANNKYFPYGKLRFSYAGGGNDAPLYALRNYYDLTAIGDGWTSGIAFPINGVSGFSVSDVAGNTTLKPERTTSYEAGVDLRFFNNRLGVDFTYYNSTTINQILPVSLSAATGSIQGIFNAGKVTNAGFEIVLNGTPVKTKDFRWDIQVNWTRNRNNVVELAEGIDNLFLGGFTGSAVRNVAGQQYGQIYGGVFAHEEDGTLVMDDDTSSFYYGYPLDALQEDVIGNPNPDFLMGIRNTLTWKGLSFSFLLDWRQGGDIWNGTQGALTFFGMSALTENRGDMTVFEGSLGHLDPETGEVVVTQDVNDVSVQLNEDWYTFNGGGFGNVSEHFIQDGSFLKLRDISLNYALPSKLFEGLPLSGISIGFTGRNFILWTPYEGIDPETNLTGSNNAQGLDYFNMPNTQSYIGSLKINF